MHDRIRTTAELHASVGKPPPGRGDAKVIGRLDDGAQRWLAASPVMFASLADGAAVAVTLGGGAPGFTVADGPERLRFALASLDDPGEARPGRAFGGLFLVPGLGETLRVNGHIEADAAGDGVVRVQECYMHCAKALIRSDFWQPAPLSDVGGEPAALLQVRFLALATSDGAGHADLSPKGDPAGCTLQQRPEGLVFADRPGNRRTDSFLNILAQPRVALAALVPGSTRIAVAKGSAVLSRDQAARAAFAVRDKTPTLVVQLADSQIEWRDSAALARARLWPAAPAPVDLNPADLFAGHVKARRAAGAADLMVKALVSVPGLMRKGLERDYDKNLY